MFSLILYDGISRCPGWTKVSSKSLVRIHYAKSDSNSKIDCWKINSFHPFPSIHLHFPFAFLLLNFQICRMFFQRTRSRLKLSSCCLQGGDVWQGFSLIWFRNEGSSWKFSFWFPLKVELPIISFLFRFFCSRLNLAEFVWSNGVEIDWKVKHVLFSLLTLFCVLKTHNKSLPFQLNIFPQEQTWKWNKSFLPSPQILLLTFLLPFFLLIPHLFVLFPSKSMKCLNYPR